MVICTQLWHAFCPPWPRLSQESLKNFVATHTKLLSPLVLSQHLCECSAVQLCFRSTCFPSLHSSIGISISGFNIPGLCERFRIINVPWPFQGLVTWILFIFLSRCFGRAIDRWYETKWVSDALFTFLFFWVVCCFSIFFLRLFPFLFALAVKKIRALVWDASYILLHMFPATYLEARPWLPAWVLQPLYALFG